jgi:hypothetical protein
MAMGKRQGATRSKGKKATGVKGGFIPGLNPVVTARARAK